MKFLIGVIVGIIAGAAALIAGITAGDAALPLQARAAVVAEVAPEITPERLMRALSIPCPTEDSDDCYWDATKQGNGIGVSFVTVSGHVFPLEAVLSE